MRGCATLCTIGLTMGCFSEALTYVLRLGFPVNDCTLKAAAKGGCVTCVLLLLAPGCPMTPQTCQVAARYGHTNVLETLSKFGFENGLAVSLNSLEAIYLERRRDDSALKVDGKWKTTTQIIL